MTENEAIKEIETSLELAEMCEPNRERDKEIKAYKMAIQALEEIQQYRAIGTVEKCRQYKDGCIIATVTINKDQMQEMIDEKIKEFEVDIQAIRNEAIDEFVERITLPLTEEAISKIVDQMKGGGNIED